MRKPPATPIPSHTEGIGDGSANSVLIPEQFGPIAEWINKHIRSAHGGWGGWPMYDYIVDPAWADTGLAEGTVINTYTGTKIYSTLFGNSAALVAAVNLAITRDIGSGGGLASIWVVSNCDETPTTTTTVPFTVAKTISVTVTAARGPIQQAGTTTQAVRPRFNAPADNTALLTLSDQVTTSYGFTFRNLEFAGGATSAFWNKTGGTGSLPDMLFEGCNFSGGWGFIINASTADYGASWDSQKLYLVDCGGGLGTLIRSKSSYGCNSEVILRHCNLTFNAALFDTVSYTNGVVGLCDGGITIEDNRLHFNAQAFKANLTNGIVTIKDNRIIHDAADILFDFNGASVGDFEAILINDNVYTLEHAGGQFVYLHGTSGDPTATEIVDNVLVGPGSGTAITVEGTFISPTTKIDNLCVGWTAPVIGVPDPYIIQGILYDNGALSLGVNAFSFRYDNTIVAVAATTLGMTNTATNYVEVNSAGVVSANTTAYTLGRVPLGVVVCAGGDITSITAQSNALDLDSGALTEPDYVRVDGTHPLTADWYPGAHTIGNFDFTVAASSLWFTDDWNAGIYAWGTADRYIEFDFDAAKPGADWLYDTFWYDRIDNKLFFGVGVTDAQMVAGTGASVVLTATGLQTDHLNEYTAAHGVVIDGVELKDDAVETDAIRGLRETSGPTALTVGTITDGEFLKRVGATIVSAAGAAGSVATDAIWDAAGDLAVGSGADTAARLAKGTDGKVLTMVAGAVAWAAATGGGAMATDPLWDALGDLAYGTGADAGAKLAGNITTTKKFLRQTGDGAVSAAPAWDTIVATDLPVGIADDKIVQIDSADVADNEYAKFTAAGLEGRTEAEFKGDFNLEDADINALADTVADGLIATHAADGDAHAAYITHCMQFSLSGTLTASVLPPYGLCVGESGEHGTFTAARGKAICSNAGGAGDCDIVIEAHDDEAFGAGTVTLYTIALDQAQEADDATLDNAWAAGDIHIRARCTGIQAIPPENVRVQFFWKELVWA